MIYYVLLWFMCGFIAWCSCLADFYNIGTKYPSLGSPDKQWNEDRIYTIPLASLMFITGPIGLLTALFASNFFKTGFRIW